MESGARRPPERKCCLRSLLASTGAASARSTRRFARRGRQETFALGPLAGQLARAAHGFGILARTFFRGLLEVRPALHFAESAFPLHLLLQRLQRLIDVVVAHENLNDDPSSSLCTGLQNNKVTSGVLPAVLNCPILRWGP